MFIKSLSLENIRSYDKGRIDFSSGTTLLTGDIGSGKTTVLLALEFALFGILRGKTSPQELLSHDANEGSITLRCEIQGKDVIITRGLKRGSAGINQTPGEIIINGIKEILVATELKAKILTLLGYPESLLAKSTNLFRYTVYTPQEQVKAILFESSDERKDVVRKIFALDKYKIVQNNIAYYQASLRERMERLKGQTDDIKTLKDQRNSYQKREAMSIRQLPFLEKEVLIATTKLNAAKKILETVRKQQQAKAKLESQVKLAEQQKKSAEELLHLYVQQKTTLSKSISEFKDVEKKVDAPQGEKLKEVLLQLAHKKSLLYQKYGEITSSDAAAQELMTKVGTLTTCPVCRQQVGSDHKEHIFKEQQTILAANNKRREKLKLLETPILTKEKELLDKQERYQKNLREEAVLEQKKKENQKAREELKTIEEFLIRQEKVVTTKKTEYEKLVKLLAQEKTVSDANETRELDLAEKVLREKTATLQDIKGQVKIIAEQIQFLTKAIAQKEKIERELEKLGLIKNWVMELFLPLIKTMEQKILLKVYQEFNAYFIQWFDQLLADESLQVKLDEDFTPVISQHGFDTHINNLSGGEKTSVALAYRLALNKVLNDYFSSIHTTGLLILDEPTDGFSAEQLDRLRDVLASAGVTQLIIVSHEQKLESLAQHIIRVEKTSQQSRIIPF
ncbi:SMC family ATPase [Candidatus Woesearchaeota archaeon]|nr:SMC family ATPase [Candidatus Woesearchaeota archaeon]